MLKSTIELIGGTPLVRLDRLTDGKFELYAKLECIQPGGSVKDRAALQIIKDAYSLGKLQRGQTVVEMTSGNMGAGLAVVCRQYGNPFIAVMPRGNSPERLKILSALGAEIMLTEQVDGGPGMVTGRDIEFASETARKLAIEKDGYYVDQFNNESGVRAHMLTTGPEIFHELPDLDAFITCVGSGGTFIGTSRYLKSQNERIMCAAVEPANAAILKTGKIINSRHIIQGTGYGLVPPHWNSSIADAIITVTDDETIEMTKRLALEHGIYAGYSSGANAAAAVKLAELNKNLGRIVTMICDTAYKYTDI